ncbi:MAG: TetR/AcrR family transcriptional regulator [Oligoflexales bacterium]|nr:TetR/AcrR family transcriptional regulator [Oligoflexales bacterium]
MSKADVAAERKAQIVQATVECIAKFGYHNFSMQDVATLAGVSKGIIHYYFLNKDDLLKSVLSRVAGDIEKVMLKEMEKTHTPLEKLKIFIEVSLNIVRNTKEYYQVNMDFWTQINQNSEIRSVIAKHYEKFRETVKIILQEGIEDGSFKSCDPQYYSSVVIAIIDGVSLQWLFDENTFEYDKMVGKATSFIIEGLRS